MSEKRAREKLEIYIDTAETAIEGFEDRLKEGVCEDANVWLIEMKEFLNRTIPLGELYPELTPKVEQLREKYRGTLQKFRNKCVCSCKLRSHP